MKVAMGGLPDSEVESLILRRKPRNYKRIINFCYFSHPPKQLLEPKKLAESSILWL